MTSTRAFATRSVDIIKRVFQGEAIASIKLGTPYVENIYDWRELKKWDIDLSKLPPDSITFLNYLNGELWAGLSCWSSNCFLF